jgi:hypothetical protein
MGTGPSVCFDAAIVLPGMAYERFILKAPTIRQPARFLQRPVLDCASAANAWLNQLQSDAISAAGVTPAWPGAALTVLTGNAVSLLAPPLDALAVRTTGGCSSVAPALEEAQRCCVRPSACCWKSWWMQETDPARVTGRNQLSIQ